MTWIFSRAGLPLYKADWTDVHSVENTLMYLLRVSERRRGEDRQRLAPFQVERVDFRRSDREAFYAGLARSGPKAVREFKEAGF